MSRSTLLLAACALLLAGCGQTGDLVLPDRKPPPKKAAVPAATTAPAADSEPDADAQKKKDAATPSVP